MNNTHEEAERILETFRQLEAHELDNDKLMISHIEKGLIRAYAKGAMDITKQERKENAFFEEKDNE